MPLALRQLFKNPGFTTVALLTLALGIGGNTAMFSLLNAVMLRALPYPESDRLVRVYRTSPQSRTWPHSAANHFDHRVQSQSFDHLAAYSWWGYNLAEPGQPAESLRGVAAAADIFAVLGIRPLLGGFFTGEEDQPGRNDVAVLSYDFWLNRFAGDTNIVGRKVRIDGAPVTVIGVMPSEFNYPLFWGRVDVWRPLALTGEQRSNRNNNWLSAIGRLKPGVSIKQAQAELEVLSARLAKQFPDSNANEGLRLVPMNRAGMDETGQAVSWMSLGLALFVLLIACANLANLQFARAADRTREFAIRAALGAPRSRLLRQLLAESVFLSLIGGGFGLLVTLWANSFIARQIWIEDQAGIEVPFAPNVFAFALVASVLAGLGFGIAPAWLASRTDVSETLKRGGRGSTSDRAHHRLRNGLIVAEVALALVLLTGAGMFIRGLERFAQRDPGWRMDGLVIGHLALPDRKYPTPADQQRFFQQLEDRLGAIPGVERAAIGWSLPVWGFSSSSNYAVEGQPDPPRGQAPLTYVNGVTPTYFETLGVPLVRGRAFTRADTTNAPAVAIINETMAQRLWPNENPIGKRIGNFEPDDRDWIEIVGVVKDVGFAANFSEPDTRLQMYRPLAQNSVGFVTVALRSIVASDALVTSLRKAVAELDPDQPVYEAGPARESVGRIMRNYGLVSGILAAFAGLGLLLTAIGIYGVMSGFVAQRRNELGVRLALGAQLRDVLTLVLSRGMHLVIWGMILGLVGAWGLARLFSATMPQLPTQAPLAVLSVGLVLACVALLACWLPARRATRVNPMEALRAE